MGVNISISNTDTVDPEKCLTFLEDDNRHKFQGAANVETKDTAMEFQGSSYTGKQTIIHNIKNYDGSEFLKEDEHYFEGVNDAGTQLKMKRLTDGTNTQILNGINHVALIEFNGKKKLICAASNTSTKYNENVTTTYREETTFELK